VCRIGTTPNARARPARTPPDRA